MQKIILFGLVGCIGVVVDFGITVVLKEKLNCNKYLASFVGFSIAATNNYFLNRLLTFNNSNPNILAQYSKFIMVAAIGVLFSISIVWLLHDKLKFNFYVAKSSSLGVVMFWNFVVNYMYTFG